MSLSLNGDALGLGSYEWPGHKFPFIRTIVRQERSSRGMFIVRIILVPMPFLSTTIVNVRRIFVANRHTLE